MLGTRDADMLDSPVSVSGPVWGLVVVIIGMPPFCLLSPGKRSRSLKASSSPSRSKGQSRSQGILWPTSRDGTPETPGAGSIRMCCLWAAATSSSNPLFFWVDVTSERVACSSPMASFCLLDVSQEPYLKTLNALICLPFFQLAHFTRSVTPRTLSCALPRGIRLKTLKCYPQ